MLTRNFAEAKKKLSKSEKNFQNRECFQNPLEIKIFLQNREKKFSKEKKLLQIERAFYRNR